MASGAPLASTRQPLLTGESVAVHKSHASRDNALERPGGENTPFVYSGTVVVRGDSSMTRSFADDVQRRSPLRRRQVVETLGP